MIRLTKTPFIRQVFAGKVQVSPTASPKAGGEELPHPSWLSCLPVSLPDHVAGVTQVPFQRPVRPTVRLATASVPMGLGKQQEPKEARGAERGSGVWADKGTCGLFG